MHLGYCDGTYMPPYFTSPLSGADSLSGAADASTATPLLSAAPQAVNALLAQSAQYTTSGLVNTKKCCQTCGTSLADDTPNPPDGGFLLCEPCATRMQMNSATGAVTAADLTHLQQLPQVLNKHSSRRSY
ncbi:unnamed protein product [Anisakis simplex]|uniref:GATA-type domain-containing protein n=1 Tax=Anisakis simplex TaxID=6269 RepID=A0A3P6P753_ANISI|nr:unnamed protein product [Anisakis simplex]